MKIETLEMKTRRSAVVTKSKDGLSIDTTGVGISVSILNNYVANVNDYYNNNNNDYHISIISIWLSLHIYIN